MDITKCDGKDCPFKETCYRYTAIDGFWQSWFAETPLIKDEEVSCEYYLE